MPGILSLISSVAKMANLVMTLVQNVLNWIQLRQAREDGKREARDEQIIEAKKADDAIQDVANRPGMTKNDILHRLKDGTA